MKIIFKDEKELDLENANSFETDENDDAFIKIFKRDFDEDGDYDDSEDELLFYVQKSEIKIICMEGR